MKIMYELKTCSMAGKTATIHHSKEPLKLYPKREEFRLPHKKTYRQIYSEIKARPLVCATAS